jgi:single-stranded DNA-binding protein
VGTISDDIVRKETGSGVLATFRLATGASNQRRLQIDVEAWGQLAGTVAHHGSQGRGVVVSERLTYKTWRNAEAGESRHRLVVTALDIALLGGQLPDDCRPATSVLVTGTIEKVFPERQTSAGSVRLFHLATGRAANKTGRLWINVDHWTPRTSSPRTIKQGSGVIVQGPSAYGQLQWDETPPTTRSLYLRGRFVELTSLVLGA